MNVSGIGSRSLNEFQLTLCRDLGIQVVASGGFLHSGAAPGADQAFMSGGGTIDEQRVFAHLPWPTYERGHILYRSYHSVCPPYPANYEALAAECHPAWHRLSRGARALHIRNVSIVTPFGKPVDLVLAFPNPTKPGGGGTGQGIRIAERLGIPVVDLNLVWQNPQAIEALKKRIFDTSWSCR